MHERGAVAIGSWVGIAFGLWVLAWVIAEAIPVFNNLLSLIVRRSPPYWPHFANNCLIRLHFSPVGLLVRHKIQILTTQNTDTYFRWSQRRILALPQSWPPHVVTQEDATHGTQRLRCCSRCCFGWLRWTKSCVSFLADFINRWVSAFTFPDGQFTRTELTLPFLARITRHHAKSKQGLFCFAEGNCDSGLPNDLNQHRLIQSYNTNTHGLRLEFDSERLKCLILRFF